MHSWRALGADVNVEFLKPKLNGARFEGHAVPLELFKDFAALQEMLVEVAKAEYKKEHPQRERIPRNFTAEIDLRLTGIEDGCALLSICLVVAGQLFPNSPNLVYFERARAAVIESIAAADSGAVPRIAPDLLNYFDRFGRSLRPGESISFHQDERDVALTPEIRQRLMVHAQAKEWSEEAALRVRVSEVDKSKGTFQLELPTGAKLIGGELAEPYRAVILEAFSRYEAGRENYVLVQGVFRRERGGQLRAIESIEHVTPLDPLDVVLRLDELSKLQEGWLNGEGVPPSPALLDTLKKAFEDSFDSDLPLPYLYPTEEGGIQAEWTLNGWEISLEFEPEGQKAEYEAINLKDASSQSFELNPADQSGWQRLNEELKSIGRPEKQTLAS